MYDVGIIGGMGPQATVEIFDRIVNFTDANRDQEHINICILNKSRIPDRTEFIINGAESPLPYIKESIDELKKIGVKHFIIPCNTTHFFARELSAEGINFINMVNETRKYINNLSTSLPICVLGTTGTAKVRIYGDGIDSGNEVFYPNSELQRDIMDIILDVKSNTSSLSINKERLLKIMNEITSNKGKCLFVIACTELSLIIPDGDIEYVDALDILAFTTILRCGYKISEVQTNIDLKLLNK